MYNWLLMLQYQLDQLDVFFSTMLGKKYTGRHPWCLIFIFSFIKEGELSLLVQRMKFALSFCIIAKLGALHTPWLLLLMMVSQQKRFMSSEIIHSYSNFFFTFLCSSVVTDKASDNWTADHQFGRDICLHEL